MKEEITISKRQLKNLLFWAMVGFTDSNGGTGERYISKIIADFAKKVGMTTGQLPPLGTQTSAVINGRTKNKLVAELKKIYPKYNFY